MEMLSYEGTTVSSCYLLEIPDLTCNPLWGIAVLYISAQ